MRVVRSYPLISRLDEIDRNLGRYVRASDFAHAGFVEKMKRLSDERREITESPDFAGMKKQYETSSQDFWHKKLTDALIPTFGGMIGCLVGIGVALPYRKVGQAQSPANPSQEATSN